jgi:ribonuclease P protein component
MTTQPIQRLKQRAQFVHARSGERVHRPTVTVEAIRRADDGSIGAGFTATRKIGGAVVRNRARRRLKEAVRQLLPNLGLPGVDYVFLARPATAAAPWGALLDDVGSALLRVRAQIEAGAGARRSPRGRGARSSPNESN